MKTMQELYTQLLLLSSKTRDDKHEKISNILLSQYEKCINEDLYDSNNLRNILQNWAEKNNQDCIINHTMIINNLLIDIKPNKKFESIIKDNSEDIYDLVDLLKNSMNIISFFDLTRKDFDLKGYKEEDLIVDITNLINHFTTRTDIIKADIISTSKFIAISCRLCMKINKFDYLARAIMMPFLSSLYKNGFTQDARNQAETYYLYLRKYNQHHLAFLIHAHLYSFQKTPHLTAINLTLSITYAIKYEDFSDEYIFEIYTIFLRMLRDAKLYKFLEEFYNTYVLPSSNERLILSSSLIYIHSLINKDIAKALNYTIEILNKYRELLFKNEHEGITSWLIIIFNLIKLDKDNESQFLLYMDMFKRVIGEEKYNNLYSMVFSTKTTSQLLKEMMPKVLNITFDSDIGYDINQQVMMAKNLIKDAYRENSIENIYLCLFYLMSPEFVREYTIKNTKIATMYSNEKTPDSNFILKTFENRLKEFAKKLKGDLIILVTTSEYMYQIIIDDNNTSIFENIFDMKDIDDWINKNSNILEVKDRNEYELFESGIPSKNQEQSQKEINEKTKIKLNIDTSPKNIVIFRSFNNSFFPHNFYKNKIGDFLSLKRPSSLNFSIDKSFAEELSICNDIGLWAPCESGDMTINMLYSRIERFHQDENIKLNSITSILPKEKLLNDIAVVITHGSSNIDETNRVFFTQDDMQIELTNVLKENKVIILFVCHSGKQSLNDYSYSIDSIIKNLLQDQTKAIIAPCWPLSIDIAHFYYKNFITKLYQNLSLGDIHFRIMKEMSEKNINPAVWGNLHYYGNPNIFIN